MSSYLTELALRTAVNTTTRDLLSDAGSEAEKIKAVALNRAQELIKGNADDSAMSAQISAQSEAIAIAIEGLAIAYRLLTKQLEVLDDKRLSFDQERQAGIATFTIPTKIEEGKLTKQEKAITGFLEAAFRNTSFSTYLGIHTADFTDKGTKFYSILPFYRMSEALGQPVASIKPLDRQRMAINLFFQSALPYAIADIETGFQKDWRFTQLFVSMFKRRNYLNDRRAPRFIMMGLSNLLWNLQHPVDPNTGFPLSVNERIELCREVEQFLNQLLNPDSPPYLEGINNSENCLMSFMRKVEVHTKALRAAYEEERLNEINIQDISDSAHRALRIMDTSIFKLIYRRKNVLTNKDEPDEKAARDLAYTVMYLNQLLIRKPDLVDYFRVYADKIPEGAGLNMPLVTVVDVLIICCHLSWFERNHLLESLTLSGVDSGKEFAAELRKFDQKFIKPIKKISKEELQVTRFFNPKHQQSGILTARRLIPLISLVIEDYRVDVDTPASIQRAKSSEESSTTTRIFTGKEQVKRINESAKIGDDYYTWLLSPFVRLGAMAALRLDELPKFQYRMTQMSILMDDVGELVNNYRNFLQHKSFQDFLLKCLGRVKSEYELLENKIDEVDGYLAQDEYMSRSLRDILLPMTKDLDRSLKSFATASANFERVVSAPDFTAKQKLLLSTKIAAIEDHYRELFSEECGLISLLDVDDQRPLPSPSPQGLKVLSESVEARKVVALTKLTQRCYDALSLQSQYGHKGLLLRDLLTMIERKPNFTHEQIKKVVMELVRVTASYRETWFHQASYGHTRSAQALISAIKDPTLNGYLPLAAIIFDIPNINFMRLSDKQIEQRLEILREGNHWQESVNKIQLVSAI